MIALIRADRELLSAALDGDEALAAALGHDVVTGWATFRGALRSARDDLAVRPERAEWGSRLFVAGDPPELVGWGGFKGPPEEGAVELGYEIAASRRNRGMATAAVEAMLAEASADERVTRVIAHTLPEHNASTRVLEKSGFAFDADVEQDGRRVRRFRRSAARSRRRRRTRSPGRAPR